MNNEMDTLLKLLEVPPLVSFKNALFVGPHPDDIEFGCGALISKLKENGACIHFLIVTDGAAGTLDPNLPPKRLEEIRMTEAKEAAALLGADTLDFIGLEDGGLFTSEDVTRLVAPYALKYQPDIIFAPDPNLKTECHNDHLKVGEGVRALSQLLTYPEALRRHNIDLTGLKPYNGGVVLAYYFTDEPNVYEEISMPDLEKQVGALMLHKSQMVGEGLMLVEMIKLKAVLDGKRSSKPLAESFRILLPTVQHVYSEGLNFKL